MRSKDRSRLKFTDVEQNGTHLKEHDRAKDREAGNAASRSRNQAPPKSQKKLKQRMAEQKSGTGKKTSGKASGQSAAKGKSQLQFEENRPKPPSKLSSVGTSSTSSTSPQTEKFTHSAVPPSPTKPKDGLVGTLSKTAPGLMVSSQIHRQICEAEDDNVGVESTRAVASSISLALPQRAAGTLLEQTAEGGAHLAAHSHRARQLREHRAAERTEVDALYRQSLRDNPELGSNPISRWQQKQAIKRQYAEARRASQKAEQSFKTTAERVSDTLKGAVEKSKTAGEFIVRYKKGFLIAAGLFLVVILMLDTMASCSVIAQALLSASGGSTYPSQDSDMVGAEADYAALEAGLQYEIEHYDELHPGYDEYNFDLDEISHDPYVLTSLLTAYHQGEWTLSEVQDTLQTFFDRQYTLTQNVVVEVRYRTETQYDGNGGFYTVQVPYNYYICNVKLENANLSHLPVEFLDEDKLHMYAAYMAAYGNRPDLFPRGEYPNVSEREDYMGYDVPPEALEDGTFAAMLAEAEKYLGFPYVWGGKNPSTSFDCSGFVSWVINHSGWNVGSRGVIGLEDICTPVSAANARPGDLVFFINTYDAPYPDRPTHVGIYVGNHMMIHCGDPISYANLNTNYWQNHFYCYARLPNP